MPPVIQRVFTLFLGLVAFIHGFAQSPAADSLQKVLNVETVDSARVDLLIALAAEHYGSDLETARQKAKEALALAEKIDYRHGMAYAHKSLGIVHYFQSKTVDALEEWNTAIVLFTQSKDSQGIANMYSNIGAVYFDQGSYDKAMEYYIRAMELAELIKDSLRLGTSLQNIAAVEQDSKERDNALKTYARALQIFEAINYTSGAGLVAVNMGDLQLEQQHLDSAMSLYLKADNFLEGSNYQSAAILGIGKVYHERGAFEQSLLYYDSAYQLGFELNNSSERAKVLNLKAEAYESKGELSKAKEEFLRAVDVLVTNNANNPELAVSYGGLARVHAALNEHKQAYFYQQKREEVKDHVYDAEAKKGFERLLFNYELGKKESEIEVLTKVKELQELNLSRQQFLRNLFVAGSFVLLIFALTFYAQRNRISKERKRSDSLLRNILPEEVANELKEKGEAEARDHERVSILFTDFQAFTILSEQLKPKELVAEMNYCFKAFDAICERYGIEKIKTIGDSYMAAGGLPVPIQDSVQRTVLAALDMADFIQQRKKEREAEGKVGFDMRTGVNTGHVVAGIIGVKKFQYDVWGDTVNTASRMESNGEVGKVNISQATYELIKDDPRFSFETRGKVAAKGKGEVDMYFVHLRSQA